MTSKNRQNGNSSIFIIQNSLEQNFTHFYDTPLLNRSHAKGWHKFHAQILKNDGCQYLHITSQGQNSPAIGAWRMRVPGRSEDRSSISRRKMQRPRTNPLANKREIYIASVPEDIPFIISHLCVNLRGQIPFPALCKYLHCKQIIS